VKTVPAAVPVPRSLPPVHSIVPETAPRPTLEVGDDVRLLARKALDYGDENARRLEQARKNYGRVVTSYRKGAR
jgi:hypothetical protein